MRLPLSWLEEYVEGVPPIDVLCERLTMAGLEIDGIAEPACEELTSALVTARIDAIEPHPDADKLTLCRVDDGGGGRSVVCGASNMKAGDVVVLAVPGAKFPDGRKIKKSKLRGIVSEGMLCSAAELGLSDDHAGIMILAKDVAIGEPAAPLIGLSDRTLEIAVTPNRGDCLSIRGLAREVSAVCRLSLTSLYGETPKIPKGECAVTVSIDPRSGCSAYRGLLVEGVRLGESPSWIQTRLAACGVRPVNNIVDITNLILFETGQPLHAFDADRLSGKAIKVSRLSKAMKLDTLDEQTHDLVAGDIVICDESAPVALAGVMGGSSTAVDASTVNVFLESAVFEPEQVRVTSRRLGLISESSYRFERGVDPAMVEFALLRAGELIAELAGGTVAGGIASCGTIDLDDRVVEVRLDRVAAILGLEVAADDAQHCLSSLGVDTVKKKGDVLEARIPSHRHDLSREIDLIEEIARLRGYDEFEAELPLTQMREVRTPELTRLVAEYRSRLVALGMDEAVGLGFCSPEMNEACPGLHGQADSPVVVLNPLRSDATQMRKSLLPGLLEAYVTNKRNGADVIDIFSHGRTMSRGSEEGPTEIKGVAGLLAGPRRSRKPGFDGTATFWDAKAAVEAIAASAGCAGDLEWRPCGDRPEYHPSVTSRVSLGGADIGFVGQLHPDLADRLEICEEIYVFEIDSPMLLEYAPRRSGLTRLTRYPSSRRDVSLVVPREFLAGAVIQAVLQMDEKLVESVSVFDEYTGTGVDPSRKALGFAIVYRSHEGTLTDEDVSALHQKVTDRLVDRFDAQVRA